MAASSPGRRLVGKVGIGVAIGLLATGVALGLARLEFVHNNELRAYDWRMRLTARPSAPSRDVVIVAMNDDSIRRLEPVVGRWPWPRLVHSAVVDFLARGGAKLIVYDGLFTERDIRRFSVNDEEWTGEESDLAFVESVSKAGNVVLGADAADEGLVDATRQVPVALDGIAALQQTYDASGCGEPRPILLPPFLELAGVARAIGHTYTIIDGDGPVRRTVPFVEVRNRNVPSLALAAVTAAVGHPAARVALIRERVPTADGTTVTACRAMIPYRGPPVNAQGNASFREFSFYTLFRSEQQILEGQQPELDPGVFAGRIVVIGATASGTHDIFTSPFGLVTPGAEIHAHVIEALLHDRTITPLDATRGALVVFAAAVAVGVSMVFGSVSATALLAAAIGALVTWSSVRLFADGLWMPLVPALTAVVLA
nr:CHASE2 domain-containing protein [Acidobacteriota bacterium]